MKEREGFQNVQTFNNYESKKDMNAPLVGKRWPNPFVFKNAFLIKSLFEKLDKKESTTRTERTEIHQALFDECTRYT